MNSTFLKSNQLSAAILFIIFIHGLLPMPALAAPIPPEIPDGEVVGTQFWTALRTIWDCVFGSGPGRWIFFNAERGITVFAKANTQGVTWVGVGSRQSLDLLKSGGNVVNGRTFYTFAEWMMGNGYTTLPGGVYMGQLFQAAAGDFLLLVIPVGVFRDYWPSDVK